MIPPALAVFLCTHTLASGQMKSSPFMVEGEGGRERESGCRGWPLTYSNGAWLAGRLAGRRGLQGHWARHRKRAATPSPHYPIMISSSSLCAPIKVSPPSVLDLLQWRPLF